MASMQASKAAKIAALTTNPRPMVAPRPLTNARGPSCRQLVTAQSKALE